MTQDTYDAVVVGAGHNGLCLAAHLSKAGLSTIVIESGNQLGGMTRTEEPLGDGFKHNPHANFLAYQSIMQLRLDTWGLRTVKPHAQHGIAFADGRPAIVLHRSDYLDRTHRSIARYSKGDADTYVELKRRSLKLDPLLARGVYTPPSSDWFAALAVTVARTYDGMGIIANLAAGTARDLINTLFETDEMRALMSQVAAEFGLAIEDQGSAFAFLAFSVWLTANWELPLGGMGAISTALVAACRAYGAEFVTNASVVRVTTAHGRATGVLMDNQAEIRARRLVASNASVAHTLLDLTGPRHLSPQAREAVSALSDRSAPTLASSMFCLREPPRYLSARWEPDIDRCFHTLVGFRGSQDVLASIREPAAGLLPNPAAAVHVNTVWDQGQAPLGLHVAGTTSWFPPRSSLSDDQWAAVASAYNVALLERWRAYAPNMTARNIIADKFLLPGGEAPQGTLLVREGDEQYRTDVRGLYLCGSSTYPGGGVHCACGHNAYQAIAHDLGLPPPTNLDGHDRRSGGA